MAIMKPIRERIAALAADRANRPLVQGKEQIRVWSVVYNDDDGPCVSLFDNRAEAERHLAEISEWGGNWIEPTMSEHVLLVTPRTGGI